MLGSRLARRIVFPVLFLIGVLFGVLALIAVWIAEDRVEEELLADADRIARTIDELRVSAEHRPEILPALAALVDSEIVVGDYSTREDWSPREGGSVREDWLGIEHDRVGRAETVEVAGERFRVIERHSATGPDSYFILTAEEKISGRRRDVLLPIAAAGAVGLLVAALLGVLVARTISRPVRLLADQAKEFAEGRVPEGVEVEAPGEIGELQGAFARMLEAIRGSEAKLRESERFAALGRLAGGIAHELRNPLTAIRMAVETSAVVDEAGRAEARKVALSEIARLERTLRELLDFVRPRKPVREPIEVVELFDDVATLLGPQCDHLKVRLETDAEPGMVVQADRDRLKQALLNLVLNAAQAQPHGGVVRLRARPGRIEVADEGCGIPDEIRESLFQPFVTTRAAGIGLGLAVVQQVAEEHGFILDYESGESGTVFRIDIPA